MLENGIKRLWARGEPAINAWLSIGNAFSAEIVAAQGYDAVTVDLQHGMLDFQAALAMLQAMRASPVTPLARVPWLDPAAIMRVLDAGAYGVICPMINTREQAEQLVSCVRYPPRGARSYGPTRALFSAGADYGAEADDSMLCFAMIETREGFDNLDRIVATPGLDGVYIGPADLALGLTGRSHPIGFDREEPDLIAAMQRVLHAAHGAGIRAAIHCGGAAYAARAVAWGFDLVTLSSDVRLLASAAAATVGELRGLIGAPDAQAVPAGPVRAY